MGNSSSHPNSRDSAHPSRNRPLKSSRRSIVDHPQLAVPSDPIPIPTLPGQPPPRRPSPPLTSSDSLAQVIPDLLADPAPHTHTHRTIQYNSTRSFGGVRRGGVQGRAWQDDHQPHPPPPPPLPPPPDRPMNEVVRSSIPLRIGQPRDPAQDLQDLPPVSPRDDGLVPTQIVWRDGGREVILAGTFDDLEWRARKRMRFECVYPRPPLPPRVH